MQPINTHSWGVVLPRLLGSNTLHPYWDTKAALGIRVLTAVEGGPLNSEGSQQDKRGLRLWAPDKLSPAAVTGEAGFRINIRDMPIKTEQRNCFTVKFLININDTLGLSHTSTTKAHMLIA